MICDNCKTKAIDAFIFRQTCINSDEASRSVIEGNEEYEEVEDIKTEQHLSYEEKAMDEEIVDDEVDCHFCEETFKSSSELALHVGVNHQPDESLEIFFICHICSEHHETQEALDHHIKSHSAIKSHSIIKQVKTQSGKKYECTFCGKRFETPSKVQRHVQVHRNVISVPERKRTLYKYECDVCGKKVESPSKLIRHMRVHERTSTCHGINPHRPFSCKDCDLRFWDTVKLERHKVVHTESFEKSKIYHTAGHLFTCVLCLEKHSDYDDHIEHMKKHRDQYGERNEVSCRLCSKSYPNLSNLIRHSKNHEENMTHQCVHCGRKMGMGDELIDHMLRHEGFKPFTCDVLGCGKSFLKAHKLKQHKNIHVENKSRLFCHYCDKSFSDNEYLKRHLLRHTNQEKSHECSFCHAKFSFRAAYNSHLATHSNEKNFACDTCPSKFATMNSLKTHQKIHTGDVSSTSLFLEMQNFYFPFFLQKKFGCDTCNMRFMSSSQLRRHQITHTGEKPYQCQYCPKAYGQSNDLVKHLRTHLGPNIYKCDVGDCTEAFAKFTDLKSHKVTHYDIIYEDIESMKLL